MRICYARYLYQEDVHENFFVQYLYQENVHEDLLCAIYLSGGCA